MSIMNIEAHSKQSLGSLNWDIYSFLYELRYRSWNLISEYNLFSVQQATKSILHSAD